jgi:RecA-family ATPase
VVPDWVPWRRVTGLYGVGGEGKTLIVQQAITAGALGQLWLGLPMARIKTWGCFCEDDEDEMHERQADINKLYNCEFSDLENMRWTARLGFDNILMTFENGRGLLTDLWHELLADAKAFSAQLAVFDTVSDIFAGNEADRAQVRQFVQVALGGFAREIDGAVIVTAHPSRTGISSGTGESGSTGWDAAFRSRLYLTKPETERGEQPDQDARILSRKKANWATREEQITLRWKDGTFISPIASTGILASIERHTAKRVFLNLLDAVAAENRHVSESTHAHNYAPKLFARRPDREGFREADFKTAMEALFTEGEIIIGTYRKSRHDHDCIVRSVRSVPPNPLK